MNRRKLRRILNACLLGLVGAMLVDYFGFPNVSFLVSAASALVAGSPTGLVFVFPPLLQ